MYIVTTVFSLTVTVVVMVTSCGQHTMNSSGVVKGRVCARRSSDGVQAFGIVRGRSLLL